MHVLLTTYFVILRLLRPPVRVAAKMGPLLAGGPLLLATLPAASRELGRYDWLTLALALAACGLLHAGVSQLLRNGAAISSWRRLRD